MLETCAHFRTMSAPDLADLLTGFITSLRAVAIDPETGPADKLAAIERITNTVAPPPPPGDLPWRLAGSPGAGRGSDGTGEAMVLTASASETHSPVPSDYSCPVPPGFPPAA
jgi:hypothetical protein